MGGGIQSGVVLKSWFCKITKSNYCNCDIWYMLYFCQSYSCAVLLKSAVLTKMADPILISCIRLLKYHINIPSSNGSYFKLLIKQLNENDALSRSEAQGVSKTMGLRNISRPSASGHSRRQAIANSMRKIRKQNFPKKALECRSPILVVSQMYTDQS